MQDDDARKLIETLREHGNQLGTNLVYLKTFLAQQQSRQQDFLAELQSRQQEFLAEQREASDRAQKVARGAAIFSAVAAGAAAVATIILAIDAIKTP